MDILYFNLLNMSATYNPVLDQWEDDNNWSEMDSFRDYFKIKYGILKSTRVVVIERMFEIWLRTSTGNDI